MCNALLNTSIKHSVTIEHKIFEVGHTLIEADNVHSCIEPAMKNVTINVPAYIYKDIQISAKILIRMM